MFLFFAQKQKMVGSFISDPQVGPSFAVAGWEIRGRMIRSDDSYKNGKKVTRDKTI